MRRSARPAVDDVDALYDRIDRLQSQVKSLEQDRDEEKKRADELDTQCERMGGELDDAREELKIRKETQPESAG